MRTTTARRRTGVVAGAVGLALALAACAGSVPTPQPDDVPAVPGPDLTTQQMSAVQASVEKVLAAADKAKDPAGLKARVSGPALTMRTTQVDLAVAAKKPALVTDLPSEMQQSVVPTDVTWPRTSLSVTVAADGSQSPRLMTYDQASARAPYKLWAWVKLFPSTTLPTFSEASVGSASVPLDDDSLALSPQDAFAQYIDVLNLDGDSAYAKTFGADPFRTTITESAKAQKKNLEPANGKYAMVFAPLDDDLRAVATSDGGAVVIGAMTGKETLTAEDGAKLSPQTDAQKALFKGQTESNTLKISSLTTVAIYVPAADAKDKTPRVLGVEYIPTKVTT